MTSTTPAEVREAVERVETALDIATKYTGGIEFGERPEGHLSFADIRTLLAEIARLIAAAPALLEALRQVKHELLIPAAEYVPAIPAVWEIINAAIRRATLAGDDRAEQEGGA